MIRGFRSRRITLVTSLLDPQRYPAQELMALYARRWPFLAASLWLPPLPQHRSLTKITGVITEHSGLTRVRRASGDNHEHGGGSKA